MVVDRPKAYPLLIIYIHDWMTARRSMSFRSQSAGALTHWPRYQTQFYEWVQNGAAWNTAPGRPGGATPAAGTPPPVVLILIIIALRVPSAPTGRNVDINRRWPGWRAAWLRSRPVWYDYCSHSGIDKSDVVGSTPARPAPPVWRRQLPICYLETYILTPAATAHCL